MQTLAMKNEMKKRQMQRNTKILSKSYTKSEKSVQMFNGKIKI